MTPTKSMNFLMLGILAKARSMFDVRICHFLFMANHFHMLLVVENPEDVPRFVGYVKSEITHAINQLLGRKRRTVWDEGYDSPIVLTASDVLRYINYIYLNPVRANLVEKISDYPGISSWDMFTTGCHRKLHKRLKRPAIFQLPFPALSIKDQERLVQEYKSRPGSEHELRLEPYAWANCFPEYDQLSEDELKELIVQEVHQEQEEVKKKRKLEKKQVVGATSLRRQSMLKEHSPKKHSPRMICICADVELRKAFILHFRALCDLARKIYLSWKRGDLRNDIPPGMFAPRLPWLASALPPLN